MKFLFSLAALALLVASCDRKTPESKTNELATWQVKAANSAGTQYSSLDQITKDNVKELRRAWGNKSGEADIAQNRSPIKCNLLAPEEILHGTSPKLKAFMLDAKTGKEIWKFANSDESDGELGVSRGTLGGEKSGLISGDSYLDFLFPTRLL